MVINKKILKYREKPLNKIEATDTFPPPGRLFCFNGVNYGVFLFIIFLPRNLGEFLDIRKR
jgi:hypothetical protein